MTESTDKCRIELVRDPDTTWKIRLNGDCKKELSLVNGMPKPKRMYLKKRIQMMV